MTDTEKPRTPRTVCVLAFNKEIQLELDRKIEDLSTLPAHSLTDEGEAILQAYTARTENFVINAVAGSGKTYMMLRLLQTLPLSTAIIAKTFHALGFRAWCDKIGKTPREVNVAGYKLIVIAREQKLDKEPAFDDDGNPLASLSSLAEGAVTLAKLAKQHGIVPDDKGRPARADTLAEWEALAFHYDTPCSESLVEAARTLLRISLEWATKGHTSKPRGRNAKPKHETLLDFDDMIYLPVCHRGVFDQYDQVVADEAQDLSALQRIIIELISGRRTRVIAAGDPHQGIYAFRGADNDSIQRLIGKFNMLELPLSITWRCPQVVTTEAQEDVSHIQCRPGAPFGTLIDYNREFQLDADGQHDSGTLSVETLPGAVLCRNNAPNFRLALACIAAGRPAYIRGREIGDGIVRLIVEISKKQTLPLAEFLPLVEPFRQHKLQLKGTNPGLLADKIGCINAAARRALHSHGDLATTETLCSIMEEMYPKDPRQQPPNAIHFSTIHKAKGLEWDDVLLLDPQLIGQRNNGPDSQEPNLRYVARTRARSVLRYAATGAIYLEDEEAAHEEEPTQEPTA